MKNKFKIFGIIAIIVIAGLSMASCGDEQCHEAGGPASKIKTTNISGVTHLENDNVAVYLVYKSINDTDPVAYGAGIYKDGTVGAVKLYCYVCDNEITLSGKHDIALGFYPDTDHLKTEDNIWMGYTKVKYTIKSSGTTTLDFGNIDWETE